MFWLRNIRCQNGQGRNDGEDMAVPSSPVSHIRVPLLIPKVKVLTSQRMTSHPYHFTEVGLSRLVSRGLNWFNDRRLKSVSHLREKLSYMSVIIFYQRNNLQLSTWDRTLDQRLLKRKLLWQCLHIYMRQGVWYVGRGEDYVYWWKFSRELVESSRIVPMWAKYTYEVYLDLRSTAIRNRLLLTNERVVVNSISNFPVSSCPPLKSRPNGRIQCSDGGNYRSVCRLICEEGFELAGPSRSMCEASGSWSDGISSCQSMH